MLSGTLEKTLTIAGEVKSKVSENEYGKKILDMGDSAVGMIKTTTSTIVEKGTEVVSNTKEIVVNKGSEYKEIVMNKGYEVKDIVVNKGSEYKDIVMNKGYEVKDMVVNKGSEYKDIVMNKGSEVKDMVMNKGVEVAVFLL
jgi:hypothetical protein